MSTKDAQRMHADMQPSPWVVAFTELIGGGPDGGDPADTPVLDVACGRGRHSRFFLDRGHPVTAVDRDISGLADIHREPRLTIIEADLEDPAQGWPLGEARFAGVIVTNYLWRPLIPSILRAVDDGGVLLYETFAVGNEAFGPPSNPDYLVHEGELLVLVQDKLSVVAYQHGIVTRPRSAVVQSICARRASDPAPLPEWVGPGAGPLVD